LFLSLGIGLVVAKSFAPLLIEVLGTGVTVGVFIAVAAEAGIYTTLLVMIPKLVLVVFAMVLCVQILMRIVLVNFYIIMSPLAFVASVLPGRDGVNFTREWITGFLSLVATQFAQVIVLFLGLTLLNVVHVNGILFTNGIIAELIKYGTITLMLRIPTLFRTNATMISVGSSAVGVATGPYLAFL
jgi:hypothetical protein